MKFFNISYKAPDYLRTGFLKGVRIQVNSMLQALSKFAISHPECEVVGALQTDD